MDNLDWINQQLAVRENYLEFSADYDIISDSVDLTEALFNSNIEFHGIKTYGIDKFNRLSNLVELIAPSMNLVNTTPQWDFSLLAAETEANITYGDSFTTQLCSSPLIIRPHILNPPGSLVRNLDLSNQLPVFSSIIGEEDGVSKIISNCENIQNLSCSGNVSSGNYSYASYESNKEADHVICSIPDEAASQDSSNPDVLYLGSSSTNRLKYSKRKEERKGESKYYCDLLQSDSSTAEGGFQIIFEDQPKSKKPRSERHQIRSSNIDFRQESCSYEPDTEAIAQVKEMIYRAAAMRPVSLGVEEEVVDEKPKRRNVRISSDPQTVSARHRRERISERLRVLQRLVPGGSKMDTATMLDEAANYLKFLKSQVSALETLGHSVDNSINSISSSLPFSPPFTEPFPMQTLFYQAH